MQEGCLQEYIMYTPERIKKRVGQVLVFTFLYTFYRGDARLLGSSAHKGTSSTPTHS
jgi:hypothetical protein